MPTDISIPKTEASERPLLPRRISPKAILDYRICPRRLFFRYVSQVKPIERPNPSLMLGNALHAALEKFYGLRLSDREPVKERLGQCLRSVWRQHRRPDTFATRSEERDYGEKGLRLLSQYAERFDTSIVPVARERWVSVRRQSGVEVFGKVDRLDGEVRGDRKSGLDIVDYKTGLVLLDDDDLPDEPAAQVYLLAVEDQYRREVQRVRMLYLPAGCEARWEPEREDVDAARERLLEITSRIYSDTELIAIPGRHCERCPYSHLCPEAGRVELSDLEVDDVDLRF